MCNHDVDPIFTNISFEETIASEIDTVESLSQSEFKQLLYLAANDF